MDKLNTGEIKTKEGILNWHAAGLVGGIKKMNLGTDPHLYTRSKIELVRSEFRSFYRRLSVDRRLKLITEQANIFRYNEAPMVWEFGKD